MEKGEDMSTKKELSIEELVQKYRQAKKIRRLHALKQFFKIKRGAVGLVILVTLTILSLLSPIIAPNPNESVHAPLSKPSWLRPFDPYAVKDQYILDNHIDSSDDIGTGEDLGKVYTEYSLSPVSKFIYQGTKFNDKDGYMDNGSATIEFVDNTSEEISLSKLETKQAENISYNMLNMSFCIKFKWDMDVSPYIAYLAFAHKFVIDVPAIYSKTITLEPNKEFNDTINLPISFVFSTLSINIKDPSSGKKIEVKYQKEDGREVFTETTDSTIIKTKFQVSNGDKIRITNKGTQSVTVEITITPIGETIYPTQVNIYFNLWNQDEDREMTPEEIDRYMDEFNVRVPRPELTPHGVLAYDDISLAPDWVGWGYDVKFYLAAREVYIKPLFQKGNIIIIRLMATIRLSQIYLTLRNSLPGNVRVSWSIDDIRVEVQGQYYGLMGTDDQGRDIFKMIIDGLKISLLVGFIATFANIAIGVTLGLVSGYIGGKTDEVIMRVCDFFMSIPGLPLLMILAFIFFQMNIDPLISIIVVLSIFGWAGMARTIRSQVLTLRVNIYVEAARASGASTFYIIRKHILPGVWPLCLMYLMVGVVGNILAEAGLSFLGILRPNWNSLGKMIQEATGISAGGAGGGGLGLKAIHWVFFPGFILMLIGYSFYAISDAYDELVNPKRHKRF